MEEEIRSLSKVWFAYDTEIEMRFFFWYLKVSSRIVRRKHIVQAVNAFDISPSWEKERERAPNDV